MTRNKGYLVLDSILKQLDIDTYSVNSILRSDKVEKFGDSSSNNFSFIYNGSRYFYKPYNLYFFDPYFELICCEILKDFKLNYVDYDLAKIDEAESYGVISKDFKIEGATYITGSELLKSKYSDSVSIHCNLEDLWDSLDERYKDRENKNEIVLHVMEQLVDLFIFDIFINQSDRHPDNFMIVEYNGKVELAPIYDNEEYGRTFPNTIKTSRFTLSDIRENLGDFLRISDERYAERIKEKLWIIEEDNLNNIFDRVEAKISYPLPDNFKDRYLDLFECNRIKIRKTIRENDTRKK